MAARYQRWLIPKGSAFLPSSAGIAKLVDRLRKERWLPEPTPAAAFAARTVDNEVGEDATARSAANREKLPGSITAAWLDDTDRDELRLVWPIEGDGAKYPLSRRPDGAVAWAVELHRASDFVYPQAETLGRIATRCACGDDLAFGWDEDEVIPAFEASTGIFHECEACSRTFDPSKGATMIANPFDGSKVEVRGGAAYRFALKVDCGVCFVRDPHLAMMPELVTLVQDEFGRDFVEVAALY